MHHYLKETHNKSKPTNTTKSTQIHNFTTPTINSDQPTVQDQFHVNSILFYNRTRIGLVAISFQDITSISIKEQLMYAQYV